MDEKKISEMTMEEKAMLGKETLIRLLGTLIKIIEKSNGEEAMIIALILSPSLKELANLFDITSNQT